MTATGDDTGAADAAADWMGVEEQLDELHRRSDVRTQELKEIAAQLPAVVGRRAMIRALVGDAANGDKREMARRGWSRFRRLPRQLGNRALHRFRPSSDR